MLLRGIVLTVFLSLHRDQKEGVTAFFEKRKPNFTGDVTKSQPGGYPWWADVNIDPPSAVKGSKL